MMGKNQEKINPACTALLLCEGLDEKNFLVFYLAYLIRQNSVFDNIQVMDFGGINELKSKLKILPNVENFGCIKKIAVFRDAENDWQAAEASVQASINASGIDKNILSACPLYLLPGKSNDTWTNGTLEDLCVQILKDDGYRDVILNKSKQLLEDVAEIRQCKLKRKHKNVLHTYLSTSNDFVSAKVGEAAKMGAFDWESDKLQELRQFLLILAQ